MSSASTRPNHVDRDPAPAEQHVLGAEIAVPHVAAVGVDQRVEQLTGDAPGLVHRQLPVLGQPVPERRALHRQRGEVDHAVHDAALAQRHDARLVQRGHPLERLEHAAAAAERGEAGIEHVKLDRTRVAPVAGGEGEEHGALAGLVAHLIALGERALELAHLERRGLARILGAHRWPVRSAAGAGTSPERSRAIQLSTAGSGSVSRCWRTRLECTPANCSAPARSPAATSDSMSPSAALVLTGSAAASRRHQRAAAGWSPLAEAAAASPSSAEAYSRACRSRSASCHSLELRRVLQPEAVEERAAIEPRRGLVCALLHRLLELRHVAGDELGIELEGGASEEDLVAAERAADGVERLVERVTRRFRLAVGPEQREQLLAARAPAAGGGDDGEQRQTPPLGGRPGVQLAVLLEDEPAERVQTQHGCGKDYPRGPALD